jgi:hypothetical protein
MEDEDEDEDDEDEVSSVLCVLYPSVEFAGVLCVCV